MLLLKKFIHKMQSKASYIIPNVASIKTYPANTGYYSEAKNWYSEVYENLICSRDRYRLLAIILGILLCLCIITIAGILPLKHYVYRVLTINQQTGEINQLKELEPGNFETNWVMTRYFIHQYIRNRHSYSYEDIKRTFNLALAMSEKEVASELTAAILDTNSHSPINLLGKDKYQTVTKVNISQLNKNTALVRFQINTIDRNKINAEKTEEYQAVVKWIYKNIDATQQDRDKNPLGFFINYYQTSLVFPEN